MIKINTRFCLTQAKLYNTMGNVLSKPYLVNRILLGSVKRHGPFDMLFTVPRQGTKSHHCFAFEVIRGNEVVIKNG